MVTPRTETTRSLLAVLGRIPGLRPATPSTTHIGSRVPWNLDTLAVGIDDELIEIRVVALAVPLPPILREAAAALHAALTETRWKDAGLRLVVTDIDAAALTPLAHASDAGS
ncbi:hypothetical protein ABT010_36135 [Streptomyces sp. NPDC002668]|uniref:hypothetical protein n=1 Tax=Streptomyces sp. NPDC002668 TaxID=3154422 RepID=UPI00331779DB